MTDGVRDPRKLGYGGEPGGPAYPQCRGKCRGTERDRLHSPAKYGTRPNGIRGIFCGCCEEWMRLARPGESGITPDTLARLAALSAEVRADARVFICDRCRYDVVSLAEIVPAGQTGKVRERPR